MKVLVFITQLFFCSKFACSLWACMGFLQVHCFTPAVHKCVFLCVSLWWTGDLSRVYPFSHPLTAGKRPCNLEQRKYILLTVLFVFFPFILKDDASWSSMLGLSPLFLTPSSEFKRVTCSLKPRRPSLAFILICLPGWHPWEVMRRFVYCKVVLTTSLVWVLVDVFLLLYFSECNKCDDRKDRSLLPALRGEFTTMSTPFVLRWDWRRCKVSSC